MFSYVNVLFNQSLYVAVFSFFAWASILAIFALIYAEVLLFWMYLLDELPSGFRVITLMILPLSYVVLRIVFYLLSWPLAAEIGFWGSIGITSLITIIFLYQLTNKFKTLFTLDSVRGMSGGKT